MANDAGRPMMPPNPESINELSRNFWNSAILRAGIKLGVFSLLEGEGMASDEVARCIGASPRYVQAFLDACVALELLDQNGEKYQNSTATSDF